MTGTLADPPSVVADVAARFGVPPVHVRRFGAIAADLEIDFDVPRPIAVTGLLARCTGSDADAWWAVPIHARIVALIAVSELAGPRIEIRIPCTCGETANVAFTSAELAAFDRERIGERAALEVDGVRVRIPTGRDQLRWLAPPAGDLSRAVIAALVEAEVELTDDRLAAIERALSDADPLVDFRVETTCPDCGASLAKAIDLEGLALFRLRRAQQALLAQIDAIARVYHWSEAQIIALPAWRREAYLALIERTSA